MEHRETARFMARLYESGDRFEVFYRKEDGTVARKERGAFGPEYDSAFLEEVERAEAAGFNVYVSAMPLQQQALGTYDRLWVDQDDVAGPWPFGADPKFDGVQWPTPTTLVKTSDGDGGFRWQAIWILDKPLDADEARSAMKRLARQIGADQSVHDPRRVLRIAGVMNAKRGSQARLMETTKEPISFAAFDLPKETALSKLLTADVQNPANVLGEWLDGVSEGDRNRKAYVAARFLRGCGVGYDDAAAILKLGAMRSEPPLDDRELQHSLDSAYHRSL